LRALYEAPLTVPLNPEAALVGVGVAVLVGVGVAVALCVGVAVAVAEAVGFAVAVALFVGVGAVVALAVAVGVADGLALVVAEAVGVAAGAAVPPPRSVPPPIPTVPTDSLKAGGVIESTAPNPVTVPAAIRNAFFIPVLSLPTLRVN